MEYFIVKRENLIIADSFSDDATKVAEYLAQQENREGARIEKITETELFDLLLKIAGEMSQNMALLSQRVQHLENYINHLKEKE